MDDTLGLLTSVWPWLMAVVGIVGGLRALHAVRRPPLVDRPERSGAVMLAAGVAVLGGLGVIAAIPTSSNPTGGPLILIFLLGIPLTVGGFIFLSALFGYGALARSNVGRIAILGIIAGPLVLGGSAGLAVAWNRGILADSSRDAALGRASDVHITAEDVRVAVPTYRETARGPEIETEGWVRLTMAVHFDDASERLRGSGIGLGVQVALRAPGGDTVLWADPSEWPWRSAGPDVRFPVSFSVKRASGLAADQVRALSQKAGVWSLELTFWDDLTGRHLVTVPVTIAAPTPH